MKSQRPKPSSLIPGQPVEEALAAEHAQLQATLEAMPVGVWIADRSGRLLLTNEQAHAIWGKPPQPVENLDDFALYQAWWPDTGQPVRPDEWPMCRVLTRGETIRGEEVTIQRFDGSRGTVLNNGAPVRDAQGRVIGGVVVQQDITDRRQMEEALRRSEAQLAAGARVAQLGTFEHNHCSGGIVLSPVLRELLGLAPQEPVTLSTILERIVPEDRSTAQAAIQQAHDPAGNGLFEVEHQITVPGRGTRWISVRSQTFFEGEGPQRRPVRTVGAVLDTTERKVLQMGLEQLVAERTAKLQELVAELEHFSYTITHDMRAPLRAMRGYAQIAEQLLAHAPESPIHELLRRIAVSANRMDALIRDALNYNQAVRQELPLKPVDPAVLLRGMLESYPELQPPRAQIQIQGALPPVLANEAGLTQCFSNLLGNAVKFIKPGQQPHIRVWAETVPPPSQTRGSPPTGSEPLAMVRLWVEDQGIGIPREMLSRVFDMFSRGQTTYEGTGIGLALVRKVVERMGGYVGVESEEGQGSRFWLELPAA